MVLNKKCNKSALCCLSRLLLSKANSKLDQKRVITYDMITELADHMTLLSVKGSDVVVNRQMQLTCLDPTVLHLLEEKARFVLYNKP